ncbi:MAG TPA: hypothetical protein PLL32_10055, partial [Anaeromyxobacteraceae bacterium]|nr:hypothetical protein [Anaeromyxobacteraceae bacterium]
MKSAFGGKLEAPGVTEVVLLRDDEEMTDLTGRKDSDEMLGGFFQVYSPPTPSRASRAGSPRAWP